MKPADILASVFVSGACAMVVEIAGGKIIAPYLGTTIYTWAATIGLVLTALSAGYYYGGSLSEKYNDRKHLGRIFFLAAFSTMFVPILAKVFLPFTLFLPLAWASLASALILVPASFFYGQVSPYAIKLVSQDRESGKNSGAVFSLSTAGSIIGTLGTGFLLIPNIGISAIFVGAALAMLIAGWFVGKEASILDTSMFLVFALAASFMAFSPLVEGTPVFSANSEYYAISVVDNVTYNNRTGRVLILDDAFSSGEAQNGSSIFDYVDDVRDAYSISKNPKRALVVGMAGGSQVEDLKRTIPNITVDGVEIDPRVVDAGLRYFSLEKDNRTNIIIDDGRRFLETTGNKYDIVLLDAFRGKSIPSHMASAEFVSELRSATNPDSVVILNLISPVEGERNRLLQLVYNTYSAQYKNVLIIPVQSDPEQVQNIVFIATDADVSNFTSAHPGRVYPFTPSTSQIITDDLNPTEVLIQYW